MMQWPELKKWREEFARVDGTTALAMKHVARDFGDALQIPGLKSHQIYTALRSNKLEEVMEIVSQESIAEIQRRQAEACSPETLRQESRENLRRIRMGKE